MKRWHGDPWAVLLTICLGFFMTLLDLTIVNIAIPDMLVRLHASLDAILWVVNGYALVLAVLLITAGRLGDLYGARTVFAVGVVSFTVASVLCGISQTSGQLVAARIVQGLGAALLMPQTLTILTSTFPPERRGAAFGVWGAVAGVAAITGPTLGGLLVTAFDWRWIFFVNLPVGVLVLFMTYAIIPDTRHGQRRRLDLVGVAIASAALFCVSFGLIEGQRYDWGRVWSFVSIPALFGAGVVLFGIFFLQQRARQDAEPLVPFALFRDRNYSVMNFLSAAVSFGMLGFFLPFVIYLQNVLGMTALRAGLTTAPLAVVSVFVAPAAGRLVDRIGGKFILVFGLTLFAAGVGINAAVARFDSHWYTFLPGFIVAGLGVGCTFAPMAAVAMRDIEPRMAGAASGVMNTTRQLGSVVGTAAVGAFLQNRLAHTLVTEATARSSEVPAEYRGRFVQGFRDAGGVVEAGGSAGGGAAKLPAGIPDQVADRIRTVGQSVFTHGFVHAMRPTLLLPLVVVLMAVVTCLTAARSVRAPTRPPGPPSPAETADVTTA